MKYKKDSEDSVEVVVKQEEPLNPMIQAMKNMFDNVIEESNKKKEESKISAGIEAAK